MRIEYIKISDLMARDLGATSDPPVLVIWGKRGKTYSMDKKGDLIPVHKSKQDMCRTYWDMMVKSSPEMDALVMSPSGAMDRFEKAMGRAEGGGLA